MAFFSPEIPDEDRNVITTALERVPREVSRALRFLRACRKLVPAVQWPFTQLLLSEPASNDAWRLVQRAFGISRTERDAAVKLDAVIAAFENAQKILASEDCLLSPCRKDDRAPRHEVRIDTAFFQTCARSGNAAVLRVARLVRAAVHSAGTGNPGCPSNPVNFEFFLLESNRLVPPCIMDDHRGAAMGPMTRPSGRIASPAPFGNCRSVAPLGVA